MNLPRSRFTCADARLTRARAWISVDRHPILADLEVLERALGLRAPEPVGRDLHLAHRVGFDRESGLSWFSAWPSVVRPGSIRPIDPDPSVIAESQSDCISATRPTGNRTAPLAVSLPDAEPAEDAVEDVVGDHGADDLAQLVDGQPEVEGDELVATAAQRAISSGRSQGRLGARGGCPGSARPVPAGRVSLGFAGRGALARSPTAAPAGPCPVTALVDDQRQSAAGDRDRAAPDRALVQTSNRRAIRRDSAATGVPPPSAEQQSSNRSARAACSARMACAWAATASPARSIPAVSTSSTVSPSQSHRAVR